MTENEIIDFLEDEINGLKEQKYGELGEIAAKVFKEINGDERIKMFKAVISALSEIQQYREIGTVEECREAVEKQKAKKPEFLHMLSDTKYTAKCKCGHRFTADIDCRYNPKFCSKCGIEFDWSEEDE